MSNKVPSLQELNKLYKDLGGKGDVATTGSVANGSKKKVKVKPPPVVEAVEEVPIYCEVHFFLRPNQVWTHVLQDAKSEVSVRGSNVLVFAHSHERGTACDHLCRQVMGE